MNVKEAQFILNNPDNVAAAIQFSRAPMNTDHETYHQALKFFDAAVLLSEINNQQSHNLQDNA